ncbi:DUF4091 domain-containing protein [Verrucomicrobiota bacterium]
MEKNTGPDSFVEKEGEKKNPYVTRRAPFRVCDAMEPFGVSTRCASGAMALRLHLRTGGRRGRTSHEISISCGEDGATLRLDVNVHACGIPPTGAGSLPYTNWFNLPNTATRHGLKPWSEAHWRMIRRYADLMVHGRQNTFLIPLPALFDMKRGKPVLNRKRLDRLVKTFTDAGMYWIEGGHVASRTGGKWESPTFDLSVVGGRATTMEGNAGLAALCSPLMEAIRENGWMHRWIQHVTDEPTEPNTTDYRILAGMVRRHMPGLPLLDATMNLELAGAVDIWCPQVQEYQKNRAAFEAQRAIGDRVWFYTCCCPGGPWLNRLLDMELLRPALFGWAAALYGLDGFLHWGLNHYRTDQDPFQASVVGHGGTNFLPAGDTHIVYPGSRGPWSSVRLEAQREGFEDYELLRELRNRDPKAAHRLVRRVIRSFDSYTKKTETLRSARRGLLQALSRKRSGATAGRSGSTRRKK